MYSKGKFVLAGVLIFLLLAATSTYANANACAGTVRVFRIFDMLFEGYVRLGQVRHPDPFFLEFVIVLDMGFIHKAPQPFVIRVGIVVLDTKP